MNKSLVLFHQFNTQRTLSLVEDLSAEEWLAQPAGFANNIAWNVGHILQVRQHLVYRNSKLETNLDEAFGAMYKGGSSPADWEAAPDVAALTSLFGSMTDQLAADVEAGAFADVEYPEFTLAGTPIQSLDDGAAFNLWHEAHHNGIIMSIKDVIRKG